MLADELTSERIRALRPTTNAYNTLFGPDNSYAIYR